MRRLSKPPDFRKGRWISSRETSEPPDRDELIWYGDDSEFHSHRGADIQDLFIYGGVILPRIIELKMQRRIEGVKGRYAARRAPLKWNVKDTRKLYKRLTPIPECPRPTEIYQKVLENADEIRRGVFQEISDLDFAIIIACVGARTTDREQIKATKEELRRYAFVDALMRFGIHVKEKNASGGGVVLDWPSSQDPNPFEEEYAHAYNFGRSCLDVKYHCGSLQDLGCRESITFGREKNNTLLQLADLVVGATKEFIEAAIGRKDGDTLGVEVLRTVREKFRGYPDSVLGRGISVDRKDGELCKRISDGFERLIRGV